MSFHQPINREFVALDGYVRFQTRSIGAYLWKLYYPRKRGKYYPHILQSDWKYKALKVCRFVYWKVCIHMYTVVSFALSEVPLYRSNEL